MSSINDSSGNLLTFPTVPLMTGTKAIYKYIQSSNGTVDVYTVPTGKRALLTVSIANNISGSTRAYWPKIKIGGTYYLLKIGSSQSILNANGRIDGVNIVFEAGESYSVTSDGTGLWCQISGVEYDNTSGFAGMRKNASWSTGDNVIYTVPTGKTTYFLPEGSANALLYNDYPTAYLTNTAGTSVATCYGLPSGESQSTIKFRAGISTYTVSAAPTQISAPVALEAGGQYIINLDATSTNMLLMARYYEQ